MLNIFINRADSDGLSEQKRLEGLITRYKAMIPVIETTMVKIDVYTKAYSFREEIKKVKDLNYIFHDSHVLFTKSILILQARKDGVKLTFLLSLNQK